MLPFLSRLLTSDLLSGVTEVNAPWLVYLPGSPNIRYKLLCECVCVCVYVYISVHVCVHGCTTAVSAVLS